jgi:hypothetical protein
MSKDNYADEFLQAQNEMKQVLSRCPVGIQNWSIQKTMNLKKVVKKTEAFIKLNPASKHVDFLKIDNALNVLKGYYK